MAVAAAAFTSQGLPCRTALSDHLAEQGLPAIRRAAVETLQVNLTRRCNLACHHCHVESGPKRREKLDRRGCERILELLEGNAGIRTLDLTGGAPELHEDFRYIVSQARALGRRVIDRCNLTVFFEEGQSDTPEFLAAQGVEVIASLPCYSSDNVEKQRGRGVFAGSIEALQRLNQLGYADTAGRGSELALNLVYNPGGASLPPEQSELEATYRTSLREVHGVEFDSLLTITNMPIKRFAHDLVREGRLEEYMSLLVNHFNPETLPGLMCRSLVSIDFEGRLYDCDFNQALEIGMPGDGLTIWDIDDFELLEGRPVATAAHCFGCTAGAGSSCGGSLTQPSR